MDARRTDVLKASPRMFESDLLDRMSRVHPIVPVVIFLPAIALLAGTAFERLGVLEGIAWFAGGYVFWTLTEYWLHRVIFHFEPEEGVGARLHWIMHGVHHDHPNDPMRLVMPPSVSVPLSAVFYLGFYVSLGSTYALAFGAGFFFGYLFYDMTHYYVHHFRPRGAVGKRLRELHMRHHFQDDTRGFGVSAPWWDHAFGTAPRGRRGEP
jgi:sterol desaturase/sphingolipid hydroxylase (fatty acid hydroxylase superfamily)